MRAVGPTLLNHVLVGILLLPLGYTTWLAAAERHRAEAWARKVLVVNTMVVFTFPASLLIFMRRGEFYRAPLFLTAVVLVAAVAVLMGAAILLTRRGHAR